MIAPRRFKLKRSPQPMRSAGLPGIVLLVCVCVAPPLSAQNSAPSTEQMIEQLKPPRTRSLRNLTVEVAPVAAPDKASAGAGSAPGTASTSSSQSQQALAEGAQAASPALTLLIQFDFDSARVRAESRQALVNLSQALQSKELAVSRFAVEGHTDAKGAADYNQKLSETRALAVRDFLKSQGVSSERLVAAGKGSSELLDSAAPFSAQNRRVRIVNLD